MEYLRFLSAEAGVLSSRFLLASLLAAFANGALIFAIMSAAGASKSRGPDAQLFLLFLIGFALYMGTRKYMLDRATALIDDVVCKIRVRVCGWIRLAELRSLEDIGKTPIQQALTQDCQILCTTAMSLTLALAGIGSALSALIYLAVLSIGAFVCVVATVIAMLHLYASSLPDIQHRFSQGSVEESRFFLRLGDQLDGFKELRVNANKARDLYENDLVDSAVRTRGLMQSAQRKVNWNTLFMQGFVYLLLGLMVFLLPNLIDSDKVPLYTIASVILVLAPFLRDIMSAIPKFFRASESVRRLRALEQKLSGLAQAAPAAEAPPGPSPTPSSGGSQETSGEDALPAFQSLRCERLFFQYHPRDEDKQDDYSFRLGPLDFELKRGQIVFLVGGNGSGKSTLLHILCGLYGASSGRLLLNDHLITESELSWYRSYFSIVLQDFHLFPRLLGKPQLDHERIEHLLTVLRLHRVTGVDESGRFLHINLSRGQKKRLALLAAECDDRQVFIFDEWAADQDPEFRHYFYAEYLPALRARGKTILAATHDDRYFALADRVVRLDMGRLSEPQAGSGPIMLDQKVDSRV